MPTECTLNEPGAVEGRQFHADLIHQYGFAPRFDVMQDLGAVGLMHTGRLTLINNGRWSFPDVGYRVALGHFPAGPDRSIMYTIFLGDSQDHEGGRLCLEPAEVLQRVGHREDHAGW